MESITIDFEYWDIVATVGKGCYTMARFTYPDIVSRPSNGISINLGVQSQSAPFETTWILVRD
jgi:hypothetical protein